MSHLSAILIRVRLGEMDGNALQQQVCKGINKNSTIKAVALLWCRGFGGSETPETMVKKWGVPLVLVFVLQIMQEVVQIAVTIVATGVVTLDNSFSKIDENQGPAVSVDMHWNEKQSQGKNVSTRAIDSPCTIKVIAPSFPWIRITCLEECGHEMGGEMMILLLLGDGNLSIVSIQQQFHVGLDHHANQLLVSTKAEEVALGHLSAGGPGEKRRLKTVGVEGGLHSAMLVSCETAEMGVARTVGGQV
jgi:hypothetical protein